MATSVLSFYQGHPEIRWPTTGSVIAFIWNPVTYVLHWMKRRRVRRDTGRPIKSNLLMQFLTLETHTRYQFYIIKVPTRARTPGVVQGLIRRPSYGSRWSRGPRNTPRSPWHADVYATHLPEEYSVLEASSFVFHWPLPLFCNLMIDNHSNVMNTDIDEDVSDDVEESFYYDEDTDDTTHAEDANTDSTATTDGENETTSCDEDTDNTATTDCENEATSCDEDTDNTATTDCKNEATSCDEDTDNTATTDCENETTSCDECDKDTS